MAKLHITAAIGFIAFCHASVSADDAVSTPPSQQADAAIVAARGAPGYPQTRRQSLVETHFGVPVADPYRWLEQDPRADPDVAAWVAAQNEVTEAYLAALPGREALRARMAKLYDYERYGVPRRGGDRYFYTHNSGLENLSSLYVREGLTGEGRLLLGPAQLSPDGSVALAQWEPSGDGRFLLYAVQTGGSDRRSLRIMDVASGRTLDDRIEGVRYSGLAWRGDGHGFFYSAFDPAASDQATLRNHRVYYHALGTDQAADRLIYATPSQPDLRHVARVTDDGRWLLIQSSVGGDEPRDMTVLSLATDDARPRALTRGTAQWSFVGSLGDHLYFRTDDGAPQGRLVMLDAAHPARAPVEIVHEKKQELGGASLVGGRFILAYLDRGWSAAEIAGLDGRPIGLVPMPGAGTAAGFTGRSDDPQTFFRFSDFTLPDRIYSFDVAKGTIVPFAKPRLPFDPADFVTELVHYRSQDGTRVPLYLVRRKDVAASGKPAPTLLYGYGGFARSVTPSFSPTRLAWIEQGGVLAIAALRGGGEYGKAWHDAGRLSHKQNVFDDFIAAAEYLKAQGITGRDQLAIEGRSNGGLLVGAVLNQRPDLFAAALPEVGVMDMLRFPRFTTGRYWIDDYGDPDRKADFRNLLAYSPYHNVQSGRAYPAILVTTGDSDDRVVPAHSFKYAAALQNADIGARPHLIRIETGEGHGAGKPVDKAIEEASDLYSFAAYWTGLRIEAK